MQQIRAAVCANLQPPAYLPAFAGGARILAENGRLTPWIGFDLAAYLVAAHALPQKPRMTR